MSYTSSLGWTPTFQISKGGEDITSGFADRLLSITVCSYEGGGDSDTAEFEIDDRDWTIAAPSIGEGSATLEISLGYKENALYEMGTFECDEIHFRWFPKTIVMHGNSLGANTAAKAPGIISYDGKSLGDIVGSIAQAAGVMPAVDPALASIQIPYLNQHSSHQHLLQELERRFNALAKFDNGHLSFTQRGTGLTSSGNSLPTFTLGPEDFGPGNDIQSNNFNSYSKVRASYWDNDKYELTWLSSQIPGSPNSDVPHMLKRAYPSQVEAQAAADSAMAALNRSTKQGRITLAKGDPSIRGGQKVTIAGCRSGINDTYVVRLATHSYRKETGISTTLDIYTEDGSTAEGADSSSTDEAPTTAPSLNDMAAGSSTVPLGQGGIGHQ